MKRLATFVTASLVLAIGLPTARAINTVYFDVNGTAPDSGGTASVYNWNTAGTGAQPASWNTDPTGGAAGTIGFWVNGDNAVFSAGTDQIGGIIGINNDGAVTSNTVLVEEGTVQVTVGPLDSGATTTTVGTGAGSTAAIQIASLSGLSTSGKVVLDGGTLTETNSGGTGGSFISNSKNLEVTANGGTLAYRPTAQGATPNFSTFAIIMSEVTSTILGTGGTTSNGGAGTLIIDAGGVGNYSEIRTQNAGTANSTFAKLLVKHGMFRFANVTGANFETAAGALPLSTLADAITLDGGFLGASWAISLDAKRGVVIGPNGGGFDNGGGQNNPSSSGSTLTINGPLSGSGELIVKGITNTAGASLGNRQGGLTLTNVNNNTGFTGGLTLQGSTLTLNESLTATHLQGDHTLTTPAVGAAPTTPSGLHTIAANKTFTFGSDNTDTAFDGQTSGSGSMTKVGSGTLTLNSFGGEWGNTGGTNINNGTIKYTTSSAGLSGPVTIGATGKLNMNGINDTFFSLAGPAGAIVDMLDTAATAGNLTLSGASPLNTTYSGTIVGGGNLTKSSSSIQVLSGNSTLGTVAINGGSLINNAAMTTTGGFTVAATATVGGTGSIAGALANSGTIAPGNGGVGTLSVTGNVTDGASSIWAIDLSGATADKLAVTGGIDLTAADTLNVSGTGTGSSWIIGTYTGTETGTFDTITAGYTVTYTGGAITLHAAAACAPGDLNCDGHVDAQDYVFWRKNNSTPAGDYATWRANYGVPAGAGSGSGSGLSGGAAVPEPTSICLLLSSLGFLSVGRRRTR